jgi:hypothetical protein
MSQNLTKERSTLIKAVGTAIGECVFGLNGPFLFNRFGQNDAAAAIFGVLTGAAVGYCLARAGLHVYRQQPAARQEGRYIGADARLQLGRG